MSDVSKTAVESSLRLLGQLLQVRTRNEMARFTPGYSADTLREYVAAAYVRVPLDDKVRFDFLGLHAREHKLPVPEAYWKLPGVIVPQVPKPPAPRKRVIKPRQADLVPGSVQDLQQRETLAPERVRELQQDLAARCRADGARSQSLNKVAPSVPPPESKSPEPKEIEMSESKLRPSQRHKQLLAETVTATPCIVFADGKKTIIGRVPVTDQQGVRAMSCYAVLAMIPGTYTWISAGKAAALAAPHVEVTYEESLLLGGFKPYLAKEEGLVVRKVKLPHCGNRHEVGLFVGAVKEWLQKSCFYYASDGDLTLVTANKSEWLASWTSNGFGFEAAAKQVKRFSNVTRGFLWQTVVDGLVIRYVEGDEKVYDGLMGIDSDTLDRIIDQAEPDRKDLLGPWSGDELRRRVGYNTRAGLKLEGQVQRAKNSPLFNVRLTGPEGLLKGNAMRVRGLKARTGADVITHVCNLKKGMTHREGWLVQLDAHPPSRHEVRASPQAITSCPQLFLDLPRIISQACLRNAWKVQEGRPLEDAENALDARALVTRDMDERESDLLWNRHLDMRMVEMDLDYRHSPTWMKKRFEAHTKPFTYQAWGKAELQVPVYCTRLMQVVSWSAATVLGNLKLEEPGFDEIRHKSTWGCSVVSDARWVEMLPSHGGCDMDDKFHHYYRMVDGQKLVVLMRDPSDRGEHTVLSYVEGDGYPTTQWVTREGETLVAKEVSWPAANLKGLPQRASEDGLTRLKIAGVKKQPQAYDRDEALRCLAVALVADGPGKIANAKMVLNAMRQSQGQIDESIPLEQVIDLTTQELDVDAQDQLVAYEKRLVDLIYQETGSVDEMLFRAKFPRADETPLLGEGFLTKAFRQVSELVKELGGKLERLNQQLYVEHGRQEVLAKLLAPDGGRPGEREGSEQWNLNGVLVAYRTRIWEISRMEGLSQKEGKRLRLEAARASRDAIGDDPKKIRKFMHCNHTLKLAARKDEDGQELPRLFGDALLFTKAWVEEYLRVLGG